MRNKKLNLIIAWQLIISCLFLSGWTYTLRTNTPAGSDDPTEADDRMREIKAAFVERHDIDHYYTLSATSIHDAADTGKHRFVTFREPNDLTVMSEDESALFSKNVSGVTELHWIDESDNVVQLTDAGTLHITSASLLGALANNTYFTAVDNAGTGTVDLIKADANDAAVVPDNSQTATNAAPTSTTGIANKKYVDDNEAATKYSINPMTGDNDSTGTITFPNGLILKWGKTTRTAAETTVTFASAFTACFQAIACGGVSSNVAETPFAHTITAASFQIYCASATVTTFRWFAVGR